MSKEAIQHYESALKEAFPSGATGDVFFHWNEARKALAEQPAQQEQCCYGGIAHDCHAGVGCRIAERLTATPQPPAQPSREWVGLTNDEVNNFAAGCHLGNSVQDAIYKAEAKLKEKNHV